MKRMTIALALVLALAITVPAAAELEELTAGGDIKIRSQIATPGVSYEEGALWFDDENNNLDWITQRTRVNVDAKMSGGVRGFIELQAYDYWGLDDYEAGEGSFEAYVGDYLIDFYPDTFQGFAGQGQKRSVAEATLLCRAAAIIYWIQVPLQGLRADGGELEKRSPCPIKGKEVLLLVSREFGVIGRLQHASPFDIDVLST